MPPGRKPKIAPQNISVTSTPATDERRELIAMYAPECAGPNAEFSSFYDDPTVPADYYKRRGYIPVTAPGGEQVTHKGDRLWKRPRQNFAKEKAESAQRGIDLAQSAKTAGDEGYAEGRLQEIPD